MPVNAYTQLWSTGQIRGFFLSETFNFLVPTLGECTADCPISLSTVSGDFIANYVQDDEFIRYRVEANPGPQEELSIEQLLEKAGPREKIYF